MYRQRAYPSFNQKLLPSSFPPILDLLRTQPPLAVQQSLTESLGRRHPRRSCPQQLLHVGIARQVHLRLHSPSHDLLLRALHIQYNIQQISILTSSKGHSIQLVRTGVRCRQMRKRGRRRRGKKRMKIEMPYRQRISYYNQSKKRCFATFPMLRHQTKAIV